MSIGSDFAKSITGNVETAILVIHDYRELMGDLKSHEKNKLDTEKALNALKLASTKQALQTGQPPSYIGSKERILKVQFNPSRLTLNGSVFPQYKSDAASEKARALAAEDMKLTMSVS